MNDCVPLSHQAGDHALSLFAQRFDHLENIHQLLVVSVVQHVPQGAEDPRAGRAVTEEHKTSYKQELIHLYISIYVLDSCEGHHMKNKSESGSVVIGNKNITN